MLTYIRIGAGILAVIIAIGAYVGIEGISDSAEETATIPPCSIEDGFPPVIGEDEMTCYWGMSADILNIPDEAAAADVKVAITWQKNNVWIGIAEAGQSDNCEDKGSYFRCDKDSVTLLAGGPNSAGQLQWSPTPGDYRFVAGGDDSEQLKSFSVSWSYEAGLRWGLAVPLFLLAGCLGIFAAVGISVRDSEEVED
ncbi:MAG TPA: hypothetical protein EYN46_03415 [Candidatus Poseidoniales archaeon]|nr:hypothetical protein [Candidatus Poseidoniales archaeon]HIO94384.1 hypothetical protein [Candidatus Poseidoniales archaeon]